MRFTGLLILAGALLALGCEAPAREEAPVIVAAEGEVPFPFPLTEQEARGQDVYETVCWTCHGTSGRGDGPAVAAGSVSRPPSFLAGNYANQSGEQLANRFSAAFEGLDPAHPHMEHVVELLQVERFMDALAYVSAVAYPADLEASAIAGRTIYAQRCQGCHGVDGAGKGTAVELLTYLPPADLTQDTLIAARDWDAVFERIKRGGTMVHGSSMPSWGVALSDEEIWDVVSYVGTFQSGVFSDRP